MPFDERVLPQTEEEYRRQLLSQLSPGLIRALGSSVDLRAFLDRLIVVSWIQLLNERKVLKEFYEKTKIETITPEELDEKAGFNLVYDI